MNAAGSRKHERICTGCHRAFNAWSDEKRERCYQCQPIPPKKAERFKRLVNAGVIRL